MDFTNDAGQFSSASPWTSYTDGNFTDAVDGGYDRTPNSGTPFYSEYIIQNLKVNTGTTPVSLTGIVPPGLNGGTTTSFYLRFRLSPTVGEVCTDTIGPRGFVAGGEVEDYQFTLGSPTAVEMRSFTAARVKGSVLLTWETTNEVDNLGFNLYRATSIDGTRTKLNANLIPALPGSLSGSAYSFTDLESGYTCYYWLEDVDIHGGMTLRGPVLVKIMAGKK